MIYKNIDSTPYTYIFVCTGNTCRSPIAEALARDWIARNLPEHAPRFTIMSAGIATGGGYSASAGSSKACADAGLSLANHKTRRFTAELARGATVIAMTEGHLAAVRRIAPQERSMTLSQWADGTARDIPDPCMGTYEEYQGCFNQIKEYIDKGFGRTLRR